MRAILTAVLAVLLITAPVSAQEPTLDPADFPPASNVDDPLTTWDDFQREVSKYTEYLRGWQADVSEATSREETQLYWADLLARALDHEAALYMIPWEECFSEYAKAYVNRQGYVNNYIAGVYLVETAPAIEPPLDTTAQFYAQTISVFTIAVNNTLKGVSC